MSPELQHTHDRDLDRTSDSADSTHELLSDLSEADRGPMATVLVTVLEKVSGMTSGVLTNYVDNLREKNPEFNNHDIQKALDKNFLRAVTGSGASAGMASAIPGVGLVVGSAAIGAESFLFLDFAASYALSSAYVRGIDIDSPERRQAIILAAVLGSEGNALTDATFGGASITQVIKGANAQNMGYLNKIMMRSAVKRLRKSALFSWIGKLLPLGVGAMIGSVANRKLGRKVITHVESTLGTI
ncbi:EcsC family protein [Corynebacterium sp. ES2794-CONJ1]|uniref:EcsC family protein n=1 Tax=unclassified Corynebacterium TaxID=2624378 RepID=UPI0021694D8E|nr:MULTISPECIES: EcsC family protein [unclassified Corynebacterium]MCS4489862.1 EcsC family protein [Corynebacterium sp. ES2775-CONJ]MCS4491774.1 EcsC family protein [Corynebacterium sp. ES2715-CONJ3]MCS4531879.1 EcsC family protein [Corynebacterium sp. ES2730-CONJ]MCU9519276.1 EcsC family protein [Corynebacterium sp. ES2794-CONJ1]